jgi:hypothetical protein
MTFKEATYGPQPKQGQDQPAEADGALSADDIAAMHGGERTQPQPQAKASASSKGKRLEWDKMTPRQRAYAIWLALAGPAMLLAGILMQSLTGANVAMCNANIEMGGASGGQVAGCTFTTAINSVGGVFEVLGGIGTAIALLCVIGVVITAVQEGKKGR